MLFEIFPKKYHIAVTMPKKNCISIQQCFVTGSQPFALKCFRVLKWNNLPWSISAHRLGIVGRYNLLQSPNGQGLLNNKYTLGQVWRHILKQVMSSVISIFRSASTSSSSSETLTWLSEGENLTTSVTLKIDFLIGKVYHQCNLMW